MANERLYTETEMANEVAKHRMGDIERNVETMARINSDSLTEIKHQITQVISMIDKQGYDRAEKKWQQREQSATLEANKKLDLANESVRKSQSEIQTIREQIIAKSQELENVKAERDRITNDYRAGTKRLSILGASCKSGTAQQNSSAAIAAEPSENRCELLPETASTVLDIARRYGEDVRKLNECIELYDSVKNIINQQGE